MEKSLVFFKVNSLGAELVSAANSQLSLSNRLSPSSIERYNTMLIKGYKLQNFYELKDFPEFDLIDMINSHNECVRQFGIGTLIDMPIIQKIKHISKILSSHFGPHIFIELIKHY
jgi:hypothetical protein